MRRRIFVLVLIVLMMFVEYRIIMHVAKPYRGEGGQVFIEVFGIVDEYYAEQL